MCSDLHEWIKTICDVLGVVLAAALVTVTAVLARYTYGLVKATQGLVGATQALFVETKDASKRDALVKFLNDAGVDAKTHYSIAIHKQAGYPWGKQARIAGSLTNAEYNAAACVSLPMFPELTELEADYVIAKVMEWDKAQ